MFVEFLSVFYLHGRVFCEKAHSHSFPLIGFVYLLFLLIALGTSSTAIINSSSSLTHPIFFLTNHTDITEKWTNLSYKRCGKMEALLSQCELRTSYSLFLETVHIYLWHCEGFLQLTPMHKQEFGPVYLPHKSSQLKIIQTLNEIK